MLIWRWLQASRKEPSLPEGAHPFLHPMALRHPHPRILSDPPGTLADGPPLCTLLGRGLGFRVSGKSIFVCGIRHKGLYPYVEYLTHGFAGICY
jgi:hypothetical protein